MRVTLIIFFVGLVNLLMAQSEEKLKIESVQVLYGNEQLHHGNQTFSRFSNTVDDQSAFDFDNYAYSGFGYNREWYSNNELSLELSLRKNESKWRFNVGASYFERMDRWYTFINSEHYALDTVYAPVTQVYHDPNTEQWSYYIAYDSLILDSAVHHMVDIRSFTRNVAVYGESLRDFKKNKWTFSTGFGFGLGLSVSNNMTNRYTRNNGLWMVQPEDYGFNNGVWYADLDFFQPVAGTLTYGPYNLAEIESSMAKVNGKVFLRPYIPVRFDAQIAEKGFFSHMAVVGSASAGMEFQIVRNDGINSRFFWNYKLGLKYII